MTLRPIAGLSLATLTLLTLSLSACNTIDGAGQDIQAAGSGVSHAANETEEELEKATE